MCVKAFYVKYTLRVPTMVWSWQYHLKSLVRVGCLFFICWKLIICTCIDFTNLKPLVICIFSESFIEICRTKSDSSFTFLECADCIVHLWIVLLYFFSITGLSCKIECFIHRHCCFCCRRHISNNPACKVVQNSGATWQN